VPGATLQRDLAWLRKHLGDEFVVITDVTAAESVLVPDGAASARAIDPEASARTISPTRGNPFGTAREIEIGHGPGARPPRDLCRRARLGALRVDRSDCAHVFEAIEEAGKDLGLKLCGLHTLDSCRIEKAFRHFGHDITDEDHVLEAGLGFAVKTDKGDFIGRDAVLKKRDGRA
jgi:glycine cleavage system aminomethyltransferase T